MNWFVSFRFVLFIWLFGFSGASNKTNQINRKGLVSPKDTEVPSPGSKEPSCRLRVMPVMVSQPASTKTDQHDETSAEQDAGCRQRL
jgi:hypothetical protein